MNSILSNNRITIFAGHYGSGKTSIAVNYALELRKKREKVLIADLDVVNPYFRTKDSAEKLSEAGIRLISSRLANTNVDAPSLPAEANAVFDTDAYSVIDLGGDDRGAYAIGRYAHKLEKEKPEAFLVVNAYRPLSREANEALEILREIETAGRFRFTGVVNNSNLGRETTVADVVASGEYAEEISRRAGLPLAFTAVMRKLYEEAQNHMEHLFPIDLEEYEWQRKL